MQYSNGGSEGPQSEFKVQNSEGSKTEDSGEAALEVWENKTGQVSSMESEGTVEAENNETFITTSELGESNETFNETFNISSGILDRLSTANKAAITLQPTPYKVKVTFDSMTVHNAHEGAFSGDGEYDIVVYVQGERVKLTEASGPGSGLWDVSTGERVFFDEGTEITIETLVPISIFTGGAEVDSCGRPAYPENMRSAVLKAIQAENALEEIDAIQDSISQNINGLGDICTLNSNDQVGVINKIYAPPAYGSGSHVEKSKENILYDPYYKRDRAALDTNGDYTLRYTISVIP